MKRLTQLVILLSWVFSFAAFAEYSAVKPQTHGDVAYVSGGVGSEEKDAMEAARSEYNVHLLFAQGRGEYVSGVNVTISDSSNHIILETLSDGPMFFVHLKPGRYTVSAELDGQVYHKKLAIKKAKAISLNFVWPG